MSAGGVVADPVAVTSADFLARAPGARAMVLVRRQSQPLSATADLDDALATARAELDADPELVPDEWVSYAVRPERVEFWQSDPERRHQRLQYTQHSTGWSKTLLWP